MPISVVTSVPQKQPPNSAFTCTEQHSTLLQLGTYLRTIRTPRRSGRAHGADARERFTRPGGFDNLRQHPTRDGPTAKAHATYTQALTLDESNPNTRFNLGVLSQQLGDLEQARTHLEWLTQRDPGDAAAWNMLGLSWWKGATVQADRCLNRAFELDPKNPDIITNRARLKTAQGRFDEIETSLRQLLSRSLESRGAIYAWLNGLCRDQRASEAHDWVKASPFLHR